MVFSHHLLFFRDSSDPTLSGLYQSYFSEGFIGVSFFFILSGFVLSLAYTERFKDQTITTKEYLIARFARIYPLHFLTFLLAIPRVLSRQNGHVNAKFFGTMGLNVSLLQSYLPFSGSYLSFNSVSWSISAEFFFYAMFPLLLVAIYKAKSKIALWAPLFLVPVLIFLTPEHWHKDIFYINPVIRICDFFIGMLLYRLYVHGVFKPTTNRGATILEIAALALLGVFFAFKNSVPEGYRYCVYYWIPMALIVLVFSYQQGAISRLLSNRILVLGGEISFAFYMCHVLFIYYGPSVNSFLHLSLSDYVLAPVMLAVSLCASYVLFKYFEMPMNKWIKKKFAESAPKKVKVSVSTV